MAFDAYIFDLDGTLLDTLSDLTALTNMVLEERGMPVRTSDEINSFVGNGARILLKRAALPNASDEDIDGMLARWRALYLEYGHKYTKPYPDMPEALAQLKSRGAKLAVLSNKFDGAVRQVIGEHFPGVFDEARGECPEIPRKPDPTGLRCMMERLQIDPARCAYVGDSGSDMLVAHAAGAVAIGVTWGYRSAEELKEACADFLVDQPLELLQVEW